MLNKPQPDGLIVSQGVYKAMMKLYGQSQETRETKNKDKEVNNMLNYIDLNIKEVQFDRIKVFHKVATILVIYTLKSTDWKPYFKLQYLKEFLEEIFPKYTFEFQGS